MKIISCLFSLYFVLLTGVTCADQLSHPVGTGTEISADNNIDHGNHDHESTEDNCSPFCGCQCCHLNVFLTPVDVHFARNFMPQFYTAYFRDIPENEIIGFFKPPKFQV